MGWNVSRRVILSWGHSVLESFWPGVIQSWINPRTDGLQDRTTPGESFYPWMERLLGKSFCHGMNRLQGSQSWLNDSRGVILSLDGTTPGESFSAGETHPGESFCPCIE